MKTGLLFAWMILGVLLVGCLPWDGSPRGEPDTTNSADGIYRNGGDRSTLALSRAGDGYMGRLTLGVRT